MADQDPRVFYDDAKHSLHIERDQESPAAPHVLQFQMSPEDSVGLTNELVIEGLIVRLRSLNDQLACRENSLAITKLEEALMWLNARTRDRRERGVEGKVGAL